MKIYFFCPEGQSPPPGGIPSGGPQKMYRHVDILNSAGFDALMLHENPGFRCGWFENDTPCAYTKETSLAPEDWLVLPGELGPNAGDIAKGVPKVIFNQGSYMMFNKYSFNLSDFSSPFLNPEVKAAIVVSEDSRQYLEYVFPEMPIYRVRNGLDPDLFTFRPFSAKRNVVSFMPRKNIADSLQVVNILKFRGALEGFELAAIDGVTQVQAAQIYQDSRIFLTANVAEGFGLTPAEAMMCGAVVVGYHAMGGREFFKPEFSYPVEMGHIIEFARAAEDALRLCRENPEVMAAKGKVASDFIRQNYTMENERNDVLNAWESILCNQ